MNKKRSVILADRHPSLLEGIRSLLETLFDYVVMVADEDSLQEAMDRLRPDLVVIDLSFPITRERNVALWLRKYDQGLRFIVLSADDDPTAVDQCMASGASGLVLKRSIVTDLIPAASEVLQGRTFVPCSTRSPSAK
ncbi:MAG TPA: response regulator transcription factor [Syntrophales bacterium]|nr:response regulator transcription factor [Syntrophales bacterium]